MHASMHEVGENCKIAHDNVTTTTCMHLGICSSIGVLESGQVLAWGSLELRRWENGDCGNLQDVVGTDSLFVGVYESARAGVCGSCVKVY